MNIDTPLVVQSIYSSKLTTDDPTYSYGGCDLSNYYYEVIQVNIMKSGYYTLVSNSSVNTYGRLYKDNFNPFSPSTNLILGDDNSCANYQFKISLELTVNTTYILVVTTHSPNVTGAFSVIVSGFNNVSFQLLSEYLYCLCKPL